VLYSNHPQNSRSLLINLLYLKAALNSLQVTVVRMQKTAASAFQLHSIIYVDLTIYTYDLFYFDKVDK
jgi:hypothetical protein